MTGEYREFLFLFLLFCIMIVQDGESMQNYHLAHLTHGSHLGRPSYTMWAIPSLMGRTCNTESPHIHHLCYWQTLYIWYNTFRNGHCFLNSTVLISWYEWWNNPSSCRSQKRWSFSAMQPLPYFPLHGDCLLWFCLICFPTLPPFPQIPKSFYSTRLVVVIGWTMWSTSYC